MNILWDKREMNNCPIPWSLDIMDPAKEESRGHMLTVSLYFILYETFGF